MTLSHRRSTHLIRLIAVVLLTSTGLAVSAAPSATTETRTPPSLPGLLHACNAAHGVSGAVTDSSGLPVAGAPVIVHAEPQPPAVKAHERTSLRLLGWARTDRRGCYHVPLSSPAIGDGIIDVRVTLQRHGSLEFVTVSHAAADGAIHQSFGLQADRARVAVDSAADRAAVQLGGFQATIPTTASEALLRAVGPRPDATPFALAGDRPLLRGDTEVLKVYAKRPVLVGQWFSSMKGVRQVWRYSQGATTELSSAFSQTGRAGSFSRSTTMSRSTDATVAFPVANGKAGNYYRSYFRYAKYIHWYCDGVACGVAGYTIKPYSWERGTQMTTGIRVPSVRRTNCTRYVPGSHDTSRGSKAVTWTNGVSIGGDLAIGLGLNLSMSAQTGFTSSAENVVTFQKRGLLCGVFGPLSGRPGMLVARQFA